MRIRILKSAQKDWEFFKKQNSSEYKKIVMLLKAIKENPFDGVGKPEPLRENWSGWWSRRITQKHRLVYKVEENFIYIASCRYHY